jgi:twitching motility two-component system response regulator PilG
MDTLPFSGLRVLIIDDSKTIRKSAEVLLRKEGCEVFTAEDGFAALTILGDVNPDVIFIDIIMPRLDGYQTCAILRDSDMYRPIPIVMLSSKDGSFDRVRGSVFGATHYLTKPFTRQDISQVLQEIRQTKEHAEQHQTAALLAP